MAKLEVLKGGASDFEQINDLTQRVQEFISDKEIISTDALEVGVYLIIYIYYKDIPWTK